MGRIIEISPQQDVVNKINAKADFTHNINRTRLERYTVSTKNVFTGKNPSLFLKDTWKVVEDAFNSDHELLGGWLSEDDTYFLDYGISITDLRIAMQFARANSQSAIYDNVANKVIPVAD
jgi:hypothetical protein